MFVRIAVLLVVLSMLRMHVPLRVSVSSMCVLVRGVSLVVVISMRRSWVTGVICVDHASDWAIRVAVVTSTYA